MWRMWIGFVISICFVSYYTDVYAIDDKGFRAHTIIIIIPYFSFEEAAFFVDKNDRLIHEAALGARNVRPAGPYSYLNNIVSISAGKRAVGVAHWNSYEKDEHFNDIPIQHWMSQTIGKVAKNTLYHPYAH